MSVPPPPDGPSGDPPRRRPRGAARRAESPDSSWADLVGVGGAWSDGSDAPAEPPADRPGGVPRAADFWGAAPTVAGESGAEVRGPEVRGPEQRGPELRGPELRGPARNPLAVPPTHPTPPSGVPSGRRRAPGLPDAAPSTPPRGSGGAEPPVSPAVGLPLSGS